MGDFANDETVLIPTLRERGREGEGVGRGRGGGGREGRRQEEEEEAAHLEADEEAAAFFTCSPRSIRLHSRRGTIDIRSRRPRDDFTSTQKNGDDSAARNDSFWLGTLDRKESGVFRRPFRSPLADKLVPLCGPYPVREYGRLAKTILSARERRRRRRRRTDGRRTAARSRTFASRRWGAQRYAVEVGTVTYCTAVRTVLAHKGCNLQ